MPSSTPRTALVLSGGGGRGAYHIGVLEALRDRNWFVDGQGSDIIAGTSIGAINGAALASGHTVEELKAFWREMHTEDVHRLSDDLPVLSRPLMNFLMHSVLTSEEHGGERPTLPNEQLTPQSITDRLERLFRATPFRSLLDTRPWRYTLSSWMDFERINSPESPALLLTATDIQTGDLQVFCNRPRSNYPADQIAIDHLMASSSILIVYPWTEIDGVKYWDGAVLANTPLGPVIDLAQGRPLDILVVMMTPWEADKESVRAQLNNMPADMVQGLSLTLDWALLASYRTAIKLLRAYNRLAEAAVKLAQAADALGDKNMSLSGPLPQIIAEPTVIAPEQILPLEWIVDYETSNHEKLFEMGYNDAIRALDNRMLAQLLST